MARRGVCCAPFRWWTRFFYKSAKNKKPFSKKGEQKVNEDISGEFLGIINYGVIGLIQLQIGNAAVEDIAVEQASKWYDEQAAFAKKIMLDKKS